MILFGASGHSKVILDILETNHIPIDFILDDYPKLEQIFGVEVKKNTNTSLENKKAIIAIGNNDTRRKIANSYPFSYQNAIHYSAIVSKHIKLGVGNVIMANVSINPDVEIGNHCIINTASVVEHDCKIADFVHLSPKAALAGNVVINEGAHIGIGATIIQGVKIGKWATVGAGAVVISDVPDFATVVGIPAKIIKIKDKIIR